MTETQVGFSIPIFQSVYDRRFEAEIDILSSTEIRVRGRMHDHRFDFEHTWQLRTPEYEVLEASAAQKAGQETPFTSEIVQAISSNQGRADRTRVFKTSSYRAWRFAGSSGTSLSGD